MAGRVVRRTRADGTILEFERDAIGNVVRITSGGVELRTIRYDLCGAPLEAKTKDATVQIEYDLAGRVRCEIQNGRRIEYDYDARGLLTSRRLAGTRTGPLDFDYDRRGRLTSLRTKSREIQRFSYDGNDQCIVRRLGNIAEERHFDLEGRLRHQQVGGVGARTYRYDEEGALLEVADTLRGRRTFEYDRGEQLMASIGTGPPGHRYTYDGNGNLSTRDHERFAYEAGNRLAFAGGVEFVRDLTGQLAARREHGEETRYRWDPLGQLVAVGHSDGSETSFGYDGFGRRVFKQHADVRTLYWWARDDLLAEEVRGRLTEYAIFDGEVTALWEDGLIRHAVTSHQGVPHELIDEGGHVVWKGEFDDWGRLLSESGTATCRLRLPGQIADPETGLHYNRFRYYLPEVGQFISPDPIGLEGGTNSFRYAPNAIDYIDLLGLKCGKSGCKKKPPNTADWELRDAHGRIKTRGSDVSGGTKPGRRLSFPEQQAVHTEGKILGGTAALTQPGDILTIRGREPPCGMCGPAMQQAAIDRGISIRYTDGTGVTHFYPK